MASNAYQLEGFIRGAEGWGLTDVLLPFLLIFTIFYAILHKTNILGDKKKNMNIMVSLISTGYLTMPYRWQSVS